MSVSAVSSPQSVSAFEMSVSIQIQVVQVEVNPPPTISQGASLLSQLQELQKSDPEKFKAVMGKVSSELRAEAEQSSGDKAQLLNTFADRFAAAAKSGDVSALGPSPQAASGGSSPSTASASTSPPAPTSEPSDKASAPTRHHHGHHHARAHRSYGQGSAQASGFQGLLDHVAGLVANALASVEATPSTSSTATATLPSPQVVPTSTPASAT